MIGLKKKEIKLVKGEKSYSLYIDGVRKACVMHEGDKWAGCNPTFYGAIGRISLENCKQIENNSVESSNEWNVDFRMINSDVLTISPEKDENGYIILRANEGNTL